MRCGSCPGLRCVASGRPRRADVGLPARRRVGLHARARRRRPAERVRRRLRRRASSARARSSASKWCADRRARSTAAARSARSSTSSRSTADRRGQAARSRAAGMRRTGGRPPSPAAGRRGGGALSFDGLTTDGDTRAARERQPASPTTTTNARRRRGQPRLVGLADAHVRVDARSGRTERGFPGPYGSDPAGRYDGVDLISRGVTQFTSVAGSGSFRTARLTHRARVTWSDAESDFDEPVRSALTIDTDRVTGRYQADTRRRTPRSVGRVGVREANSADNTFMTGEDGQADSRQAIDLRLVRRRPAVARRRGRSSTLGVARRTHRAHRARRRSVRLHAAAGVRRRRRLVGESESLGGVVPEPAGRSQPGRRSAPAPAPASSRRRRSRSRSPTTPVSSRSAAEASSSASSTPSRHRRSSPTRRSSPIATTTSSSPWAALRGRQPVPARTTSPTRARGASRSGARWRPIGAVAIRAAWTWLDTEILGVDGVESEAPPPYQVGDELIRRPRHQAVARRRAGLTRARRRSLSINGRGETRDLEPNFASRCSRIRDS